MICLWLNFAATLNVSMAWLRGRYLLAAALRRDRRAVGLLQRRKARGNRGIADDDRDAAAGDRLGSNDTASGKVGNSVS